MIPIHEVSQKLIQIGGWSQDGGLGGRGIRVSSQLGPLPGTSGGPQTPTGTGGSPQRPGRTWGVGRVRGEEKWRRDRTGAPEGRLGEGKGSHARRGKLGNPWEGRGSKGSVARFPLPTWTPRNLLRSRGLILCPPRPLPAVWVRREWEGGKVEQK